MQNSSSEMPTPYIVLTIVIVPFAIWFIVLRQRRPAGLPLPPGPPRLPVIGNIHQAPKEWPWRTYAEWAKTYGPIYSLKFGRDTIIMLSSHTTARDLLDKRSNIYSSRPHLAMGTDCVSKGNRSVLMPHGPQYRIHQRIQGGFLTPRLSAQYTRLQDMESRQLMFELLTVEEDDWMDRFHRYASSLVYSLLYGKRIARGDEKEVRDIEQVMENFLYSARVGTWIVDAIPILNRLPKFLAPWKQLGDQYHEFESSLFLQNLKNALDDDNWNLAKQAMSMKESQGMPTKELAYLVGTIFEAGSDTTTVALRVFVLAARLYPDVYNEAQKSLDKILDEDHMPQFEHRVRLPHIEAIAKEVLRWRPVTAGGMPHALEKDDEYMGFHIPKGATVIGNHWAIDHDTDVYGPDAEDFRPSRWIENPDLPLASFGYGRRLCTGQHIAMNSLYIVIARLIWAFDIRPATDTNGKPIEVDPLAFTQGFNSGPLPFKVKFTPRSERRRKLVEDAWNNEEKDVRVLLDQIVRK